MPNPDMTEYYAAVDEAHNDGRLPLRLARKLKRTLTPKMFYMCLKSNKYMGDVWDATEGKDKYPWTE